MENTILLKLVKKLTKTSIILILTLLLTGFGPLSSLFLKKIKAPEGQEEWVAKKISEIMLQANNIDRKALKLGLVVYLNAKKKGLAKKEILTLIDYSKPSTRKRLWVIDVKNAKILMRTWVSHGAKSGKLKPTSFSNDIGSLKSSLGVFKTTKTYTGGHGYSLRLVGLENGINDHALSRYIVIHGADYANHDHIEKHGFLGRSSGCPAVSNDTVKPLINTIKDNSLVVVYYPDRKWINNSTFL